LRPTFQYGGMSLCECFKEFQLFCYREREFKVVIKFATHVSMHQLRELLSGKQVKNPQEAISVFDIVLRELAAQRCICGCSCLKIMCCLLLNH